jgi:hypothetical protein
MVHGLTALYHDDREAREDHEDMPWKAFASFAL